MRPVRDPKIERIAALPLFAGATDEQLAAVAAAAELVEVPRHTELTHAGDRAELVYVLLDGLVQVRRGETVLAYLGDGDVVGELAVLDQRRRRATVTAVADTELLVIERRHLGPLLDRSPKLAARLERIAAPRRAA